MSSNEGGPNPPYFPPDVDAFHACWFGVQLAALEEDPLWPPSPGVEVYRFTWLRTFHQPVTVRLEIGPDQARMRARVASGAGGYDPGTVTARRQRNLRLAEARALAARLELVGDSPDRGLDGAEWILESVRDGQYTYRAVWSPESGPFREGCLELLKASRLRVRDDEVY